MSKLGNKQIMSRNIQKYMALHNMTRTDLCEALGVKYTTLTDWIKGNTYPRIDWIEKMANYFEIRKSDLVEDSISFDSAYTLSRDSLDANNLHISFTEKQIITAYRRASPAIQQAVLKLLDVPEESEISLSS